MRRYMSGESPHFTEQKKNYFLTFLLFFTIAHLNHHILGALITPLLPFIRDEFFLDYTQAGFLVSAFTITYGLSHLPSGWFLDRIGTRKLILLSISGAALFGFIVGLTSNYFIMVISLVCMGILGGGYHPAASLLISSSFKHKYRGRALGIHQIGGTASFFLSPLRAVGIAYYLNWRGSFLIISIFNIVYGIIFFLALMRVRQKKNIEKTTMENRGKSTLGYRFLIISILMGIIIQAIVYSSLTFIPFYTIDNLGGDEKTAALFLSIANSSGLWAGPLGGYLSDRWSKIKILYTTGLFSGFFILLLKYASLGYSVVFILILLGMCQYMVMPLTEILIISETPKIRRSKTLGFYYFGSRGGPGIIIPMMGFLIDKLGFHFTFFSIGFLIIIITITCMILLYKNRY